MIFVRIKVNIVISLIKLKDSRTVSRAVRNRSSGEDGLTLKRNVFFGSSNCHVRVETPTPPALFRPQDIRLRSKIETPPAQPKLTSGEGTATLNGCFFLSIKTYTLSLTHTPTPNNVTPMFS